MCRRFQKPCTTHCTLRRALISTWSRSAHPQYSTITDCLCSRVATPPPPAVSLSLSLSLSMYAWCLIPMAVNCTATPGGRLLHAPAERGKTPAWSPVLSTQLWPPGGSSDIEIRGLMCHAGLWPTHVTQLTHFVGHTPDVLAWHQITASPQTFAHAIKPAWGVFWTMSIASRRSFANLLITCMHPRTFLCARK